MHVLAKMDPTQRHMGREHPLTNLRFGLQGAFFAHVWSGRSPDFEKYDIWAGPRLLP